MLSQPCCADLALASESEESVLSPFSPFDSQTVLTGNEKLNQQGQATALQIAELLTRTRLAALLKCCNLKLGPAGAGNCSTDLSTGFAELLTRTGAGNCLTDLSTGIADEDQTGCPFEALQSQVRPVLRCRAEEGRRRKVAGSVGSSVQTVQGRDRT